MDAQVAYDALKKDTSMVEARNHHQQGNLNVQKGDLKAAVDEFSKGIKLLLAGGDNKVMDLMVKLRFDRCSATNKALTFLLNYPDEVQASVEQQIRDMIDDGTAVLDLPALSSNENIVDARCFRTAAVSFLVCLLGIKISDAEVQMAHQDGRAVLADPTATEIQKESVLRSLKNIQLKSDDSDIAPCFLTENDLLQVTGLNIRQGWLPLRIARSFMNKNGPVNMSDGSPKQIPPHIGSPSVIQNMSFAQLNRTLGMGAGTFFGEIIFWKRHGGVRLGKQKWETEGTNMNDINTVGEVWDMRWVFETPEGARGFFKDMVEASRAENSNGLFDSLPELTMKPSERSSLSSDIIDIDYVALSGNTPRKKPKNMDPRCSMAAAEMYANPPAFLQNYVAVFVVNRVMVKCYVIEGFNSQTGPLKRSALFGDTGLINRCALRIKEWLNNTKKTYQQNINRPFTNMSTCANCGKHSETLKQCARCKSVAYCNRECQVAHYKVHKKPCRMMVSSI